MAHPHTDFEFDVTAIFTATSPTSTRPGAGSNGAHGLTEDLISIQKLKRPRSKKHVPLNRTGIQAES
jgi:hypothetical protein